MREASPERFIGFGPNEGSPGVHEACSVPPSPVWRPEETARAMHRSYPFHVAGRSPRTSPPDEVLWLPHPVVASDSNRAHLITDNY
jgi:hypothetical protein